MAGPLSHVRVLDLSRIMAGPWAGQILADLGADVIKVERPGRRRRHPQLGPAVSQGSRPASRPREAGYYLSVNRGKRSITLDLDKPEGQRSCASSRAALRHRAGELQGRHARALRPRLERLKAGQPEADLLLGHRLWPDRAARRRRRLRLPDPGHGRPDERHRRDATASPAAARRRSAFRSSTS